MVHGWVRSNKVKLATSKFKYMNFGNKIPINSTIKVGADNIKRVKSMKYLGIIVIDEKLTFQEHVKSMTEKAKNIFASLRRSK